MSKKLTDYILVNYFFSITLITSLVGYIINYNTLSLLILIILVLSISISLLMLIIVNYQFIKLQKKQNKTDALFMQNKVDNYIYPKVNTFLEKKLYISKGRYFYK